jgi:hypothetical protein
MQTRPRTLSVDWITLGPAFALTLAMAAYARHQAPRRAEPHMKATTLLALPQQDLIRVRTELVAQF